MPDLPTDLVGRLRPHVGAIHSVQPVGGGCIANATRIETERSTFFLKWSGGDAGRTFEAEAAGLRALRSAGSPLLIPEVIAVDPVVRLRSGFLLMAWIEPGPRGVGFWSRLGEGLAALHRTRSADGRYGFETDNFIGRIEQANAWRANWPDFFRFNRLGPQIGRAREMGRWRQDWHVPADRLWNRLDELLPEEPPASLLHGDLWSGNFLTTADGRAALIDPACYYGDRETDLALTELFGGFDATFYEAYQEAWPLDPGYADRRDLYNLYHLLNHLNHFGDSYAGQVERVLRRFA